MSNANDTAAVVTHGLFLGRCQPFTLGHDVTIQHIRRDGHIPIIMLGSTNKHDAKNPLSFVERCSLIETVYPDGVIIVGIEDKVDWTEWYESILRKLDALGVNRESVTLYAHTKENDRTTFECRGKTHRNAFYTEMFREDGIRIKVIDETVDSRGETIHASAVRACEQTARRHLDARVFTRLKNVFGWWRG
jgi:nicotinamide mononucleotide adenylyltransferase